MLGTGARLLMGEMVSKLIPLVILESFLQLLLVTLHFGKL